MLFEQVSYLSVYMLIMSQKWNDHKIPIFIGLVYFTAALIPLVLQNVLINIYT